MSIYINSMKMPERCYDCDLCYDMYRCKPLGVNYSGIDGFEPADERLPNCPLVPVPPHGRLIDADALRDNNNELFEINGADGTILAMDVSMIDNAPTIIPADKEGET